MKFFNTIAQMPAWHFFIQILLWLGTFLAPMKISIGIVMVLIVSDLLFGIWDSIFVKREPFSSRALRRTARKIFVYEFLAIFAYTLQKYVWPEHHLLNGFMSFISVVESISILEHIKIITGIDFIAYIFKSVKQDAKGKFLFKLKPKTRKKSRKRS